MIFPFFFLLFAILHLLSSCVTSFNIRKCEGKCLLQTSNVVGYTRFQLYIYHLAETLFARLVFVVQIWVSTGRSLFYAISFCAFSFEPYWRIYTTFRIYAIRFGLTRYFMEKSSLTCLVLKPSNKWRHCHSISHVYGLITLVIESWAWGNSPFIIIGFWYENVWQT